jgi:hypothetical protein
MGEAENGFGFDVPLLLFRVTSLVKEVEMS